MQASASESAATDADDTAHLLKGILAELKNIGGQLRKQEERIGKLERRGIQGIEDETKARQSVNGFIPCDLLLAI